MPKIVALNNKLTRRVLVYILLCSSFLSVCSTVLQVYVDYKDSLKLLEQRFDNISSSQIQSISTSLWDFNEALINQQIEGIVTLPDIQFAKITASFGKTYQYGTNEGNYAAKREYKIYFEGESIGLLRVEAHYDDIYRALKQRAGFIIASEFVKIFIVALLMAFIVHWLITRHLYIITDYSRRLSGENLAKPLILENRSARKDELDILVDAINTMRLTLKSDIVKLEEAENALINLNGELEIKVYDRTAKLATSNEQLQQSLDDLTLAKDQLVQSEKMASLGQLVAGVAHEVNTPLGICVTSTTALKEKVQELTSAVSEGKLSKTKLVSTLALLEEYQTITERSLNKAVELIRGFKSVAVEYHTDPKLSINLAQHVNDVVNTVKTLFKKKHYEITVDIDKDLNLVTFPSAWNQIITNFLMNSHIHGFENQDKGKISLKFEQNDDQLELIYQDNGRGLADGIKQKIFDPFVTTKRGQGGSGLGMNIVFNLVNSKLDGSIEYFEPPKGCGFKVVVPFIQE